MKKLIICIIAIALTFACNHDDEEPSNEIDPDEVLVTPLQDNGLPITKEFISSVEVTEVVKFNDKYLFAGYNGFMITDQNLNELDSYEEYMILGKLLNYRDEFVCVCTTEGIYQVDNTLNVKKIIDLPCSDMETDSDGEIIFVSSDGELSQERQIPANILVLDVTNQSFDFYTDPSDSIGAFLGQIEVLSNGEIFALGGNATVYHYKDQELFARYSKETADFFPEDKSGIGTGYELLAVESELFYITPQLPKRLLTFRQSWQTIFDISVEDDFGDYSGKDWEILRSSILGLDMFKDEILVGTQNGIVKVNPATQEYDFIKDPNFPNQFIRSTYFSTESDELIVILAGNNIVKYQI
ncbi:MAG: hypothetical protein AAF632_27530 [Bacteroidota bacterium]